MYRNDKTGKDVLVGVIESRNEPYHDGHKFMFMMAYHMLQAEAERRGMEFELHVIVCSHDGEWIDGYARHYWVRKALGGYGNITVHHAHNALEHVPGYGDDYHGPGYTKDWTFWGKVATDMCGLGDTVDYFYGSEPYVPPIAVAMGAEPVLVDQDRETLLISGSVMRDAPDLDWDSFPDVVKPYFAKRICIIGAPYVDTQKLAKQLSIGFNTPMVCEVADFVYDPKERGCTAADLEEIAQKHLIRMQALQEKSNRVILSDTDVLLTYLWHEALFGTPPEWMRAIVDQKFFDLYILVESEGVSFTPSHSFPDEKSWHAFTETIRAGLDARNLPYVSVSGPLDRQYSRAAPAIHNLCWHVHGAGKCGWEPGPQKNIPYQNREQTPQRRVLL